MKKITCSALLLGLSLSAAHAQIAAGTKLLGGGIAYRRGANEVESSTANPQQQRYRDFNISPRAGYFVLPNLAVGLEGQFGAYKNSATGTDTYRYLGYSVGPFARYYKFFGEQFGLTLTGGAGFAENWSKYKWYDPSANSHARGAYAQLTPGVVFFPTAKLGLEATIGGLNYAYSVSRQDYTSGQTPTSRYVQKLFSSSFGFNQFTLGASFYPGR